jgi:hypothetical protein
VASIATPPFLGDDDTDLMRRLNDQDEYDLQRLPPFALNPQSMYPQVAAQADPGATTAPDATGPVPLGMRNSISTTTMMGPSPGPAYMDKLTQLENVYGDRPKLAPPKWWQRGLGAAAGFGAGWSNAASRTKHPLDIGAMRQDILYPGAEDKLAQWQSKETPLEAQAKIEAQKQGAWWKQKQEETNEAYRQALGEQARAHGAYWLKRAQLEQNQWRPFGKNAALNTLTGEIRGGAKTPKDRYDEMSDVPGATEGMKQYYAANGSLAGYGSTLANPDKPEAARPVGPGTALVDPTGKQLYMNPNKPGSGRGGQGTANQFKQVEQKKGDRYVALEKEYRAKIATLGDNPDANDLKLLNDQHEAAKQGIENDYANEISALGADPERYSYYQEQPGGGPQPGGKPKAPAALTAKPQQTAAPTYTEAQVRAGAIAKGKNPDAAVKLARERKLIP